MAMVRVSTLLCAAAVLLVACSGGSPAGTTPSGTPAGGASPSLSAVPNSPSASLDPSQSDAGIVADVTITGDTRANRDGTYTIYGRTADGSQCSYSLDSTVFGGVAWFDAAPNGSIHRFSVTVPEADVPAANGSKTGISGRVSFDFASGSGSGTTYTGDASETNSGQSTTSITRTSNNVRFDFTGTTWDNVTFAGTMICARASIRA